MRKHFTELIKLRLVRLISYTVCQLNPKRSKHQWSLLTNIQVNEVCRILP
jgi:hypothetical protein